MSWLRLIQLLVFAAVCAGLFGAVFGLAAAWADDVARRRRHQRKGVK